MPGRKQGPEYARLLTAEPGEEEAQPAGEEIALLQSAGVGKSGSTNSSSGRRGEVDHDMRHSADAQGTAGARSRLHLDESSTTSPDMHFKWKIVGVSLAIGGLLLFTAYQVWALVMAGRDAGTITSSTIRPDSSADWNDQAAGLVHKGDGDRRSLNLNWTSVPIPITGTETSVRLFDVNGDGVLDLIVGLASDADHVSSMESRNVTATCLDLGFSPCGGAVVALDGRTGSQIWLHPTKLEIFAIVCGLLDGNGDGVMDCLVAGRLSQLRLIDSRTGRLLWDAYESLKPFLVWNVYTPIVVPDMDGDGVKDVLVAHGGDARAAPWETCRRAGELRFFSGASGKPIGDVVPMPEHRETYMSPVLFNKPGVGEEESVVFFGTGGETINGSLWAIRLKDLKLRARGKDSLVTPWRWGSRKSEAISPGAIRLVTGVGRGVAVPPVIADMTGDAYPDILVSVFDGTLVLLDGKTSNVVWQHQHPGWEFYSSPAIGRFNGDSIPDVVLQINKGSWFTGSYEYSVVKVLDGRDGSELWHMKTGTSGARSPLVLRRSPDDRRGDLFVFWVAGRKVWQYTEIVPASPPPSCHKCGRRKRGKKQAAAADMALDKVEIEVATARLSTEGQQVRDRQRRHGNNDDIFEQFEAPTDETCGWEEKQLSGKIKEEVMHIMKNHTRTAWPPGSPRAGCTVDEAVYDVETFLLDFEHQCYPVKIDSLTTRSISYADAMKKYDNDPLWHRRKQALLHQFSEHDQPHVDGQRKKRHGNPESAEEQHVTAKTLPSYDPRLCAMLRPALVATPAIGDLDGDGNFELALPTAHMSFVSDSNGFYVRTEYLAMFRVHDLFPPEDQSAVSYCRPGSDIRLKPEQHMSMAGVLPARSQPWLGYLGTCATSDATRLDRCGAV